MWSPRAASTIRMARAPTTSSRPYGSFAKGDAAAPLSDLGSDAAGELHLEDGPWAAIAIPNANGPAQAAYDRAHDIQTQPRPRLISLQLRAHADESTENPLPQRRRNAAAVITNASDDLTGPGRPK